MKCTLNSFFIFAVGAAIGSAVTWKLTKDKYERIAREEIAEMREYVRNRNKYKGPEQSEPTSGETTAKKMTIKDYAAKLDEMQYIDYSTVNLDEKEEEVSDVERPYVIKPEEFDTIDGYDIISLTYYADKVLADDMDGIVENVDEIIGYDSLTHFGEYEDDSVFVRNDRMKCDYEILADTRCYSDVVGRFLPQITEE